MNVMQADICDRGSKSVVLGLFDREPRAREAVAAVRRLGLAEERVGVLVPGRRPSVSGSPSDDTSGLLAQAASAADTSELTNVLLAMGVPDGEARFYASEARDGRTLVVVDADGHADEVRKLVLDHGGYDVQSRGRDLIRGGVSASSRRGGPLPLDVTTNWPDFSSRYEMLWQQHYGTSDSTWEQMEPIYRYAWQLANDPRFRGRPWSEVDVSVEHEWSESGFPRSLPWAEAAGPVRDVWEDVAQEAATGAEGGADRRIPHQGTDQSLPARDIEPPRQGAT